MTHQVKNWLQSKGWKLTPIGDCFFVETPSGKRGKCNIRWKTKPVWGKRARRYEWSVPRTSWERYRQQGIQGLFIFEPPSGSIFFACIGHLAQDARIYYGNDLDEGGTVFIPVARFKRLATVTV